MYTITNNIDLQKYIYVPHGPTSDSLVELASALDKFEIFSDLSAGSTLIFRVFLQNKP